MSSTNSSTEAVTDSESAINFSAYVIKKTGYQQSATTLKVDVYNLIGIPYQMSAQRILLLVSLSREEIVFFQKYKNALAGLSMSFELARAKEPMKLFARCTVLSVAPMRGRDNVALLTAEFKPCPKDLIDIIENYRTSLERLRLDFQAAKDDPISVNPHTAKTMGYNNYAVFSCAGQAYKTALLTLSAKKATLLFPSQTTDFAPGQSSSLKLYFQKYQFSVPGTVASCERLATGVQRMVLDLGFAPELMEILDSFRISELARKAMPATQQANEASPV